MLATQYKNLLLLLLIFLISMWTVNYSPEHKIAPQAIAAEYNAEHFVVGYSKMQMNKFGLAGSRLTADLATHYSDNTGTELTNPRITVFKQDAPPWIVRSEAGHISPDGNQIFMRGAVFINRVAAKNVREVNIKTSNLRVFPNRNYATTDDWTELVSGLDRISGVGMALFYQDPLYIKLLNNVKGLYQYH